MLPAKSGMTKAFVGIVVISTNRPGHQQTHANTRECLWHFEGCALLSTHWNFPSNCFPWKESMVDQTRVYYTSIQVLTRCLLHFNCQLSKWPQFNFLYAHFAKRVLDLDHFQLPSLLMSQAWMMIILCNLLRLIKPLVGFYITPSKEFRLQTLECIHLPFPPDLSCRW